MSASPLCLVASLQRGGRHRLQGWIAEVTDPASPVAGLTVRALTRRSARHRLALTATHELGLCQQLPLQMEVIEWQGATYRLSKRP